METSTVYYSTLDKIIQNLYEDKVAGKISEERYMKMSDNYEAEQKALTDEKRRGITPRLTLQRQHLPQKIPMGRAVKACLFCCMKEKKQMGLDLGRKLL